jgi:transposase
MDVLIERCAGLDVHKRTVVATVRSPGAAGTRRSVTQSFSTTVAGLQALEHWLTTEQVSHVAMESTGVYWRPVYAVLEATLEVCLVNPRAVKHVPGRKTDVRDSEWLAQLLECGLLRASFIPPPLIRDLRDLTRYRKVLIRERAHHVNRVEKTLELAQIKLGSVVTDLMGKTGRAILSALLAGETDPALLAGLAQGLLKKKTLALQAALTGGLRPHYAFLLRQQLQTIDHLTHQIAALDEQIAQVRAPLAPQHHLVCTVPGIAARASEAILAEIGTDMARFPSPGHLASWARVCPGTRESAGKRGVTTTGKANNWLRAALNEAAWAASRTKRSYYHALYHRMKARQGPKKAIGAVQHAMLRAIWYILTRGVPHDDLGADYLGARDAARTQRHHVRRLELLGYRVVLEPAA